VVWDLSDAIKEIIGETVGFVRNDRFCLGIQALNARPSGGIRRPRTMSCRDAVTRPSPRNFGSVLQAFTSERRPEAGVISQLGP